jgi:hypothetical protein
MAVLCRGLEKNGMVRAWQGRGVASVNQTRPHCVNKMGYIATEWQWERLYCDGVAVGQVILRRSGCETGYIATKWL